MIISIIAAVSDNGIIGANNRLLWHLPDDLKNFKQLTMGSYILMGRKTWESIGKPLPGRTHVVITRNPAYKANGCIVVNSVDQAIEFSRKNNQEEIFIIGGGQIYNEILPRTDKLYLTKVHANIPGDTHFPEVNWEEWEKIEERKHDKDAKHKYPFDIIVYKKKS